MSANSNSDINKGNQAFRESRYGDALAHYSKALQENPELKNLLRFNIELTHKKLLSKADQRIRTLAITMVKNEAAILHQWLSHALSLFDEVHVVDHASTDGSRTILAGLAETFPALKLYCYDQEEFLKLQIMTHIARHELKAGIEDWVFFLDADEFLPFGSRQEFIDALARHSSDRIIRMHWLNLIPEDYGQEGYFDRTYLVPPTPSSMSKIAFRPFFFRDSDYFIQQGNHDVIIEGKLADAAPSFNLIHIPVRSFEQIARKVRTGMAAYQAMHQNKAGFGFHWFEIDSHLKTKTMDEGLLNGIACTYSEKGKPITPVSHRTLRDAGYRPTPLSVATLAKDLAASAVNEPAPARNSQARKPCNNVKKLTINPSRQVSTLPMADANPAHR